jgi:hypothetical protein
MSIQTQAADRNSQNGKTAALLTLAILADAKRLPLEFLEREGLHDLAGGRGVGICYCDVDGTELYVKRRTALKAKEGSFLPTGAKQFPYLLNHLDMARRDGMLFLSEGETDALTLLFHGYGALGMPGASSAKCLTAEALECIDRLFILRDGDAAGKEFVKAISIRLKALDFRGRVAAVTMPAGAKDPSDLHCLDPDAFKQRLAERLAAAEVLEVEKGDAYEGEPRPGNDGKAHCSQAVLIRMDTVRSRPVEWLWEGWIPYGTVTLIEGDPDLGKSTLTADLAARVSRGWRMPPAGGPAPDLSPVGVLLLSAEDSLEQTIKPRLDAAEGDSSRITTLFAIRTGDSDERPPILPYDLTEMEAAIRQLDARLVVVDPLMAFLDGEINSHRDQDIRRAMHQFKLLAERTGAALVVVRHLNKLAGSSAMYRGGGSIGIIGAARSALLVARDPTDRSARVMASVKSNLSRKPASLRYRVESATAGGVAVGRIGWIGECDLTADDLVARLEPPKAKSKAEQCAEAIGELIGAGRMDAKELDAELGARGFSQNAIRDGKRLAKVKPEREGFGPNARYWLTLTAEGDGIDGIPD